MESVINFYEAQNRKGRTDTSKSEEIRPIIDFLWEMEIGSLIDFCRAVEISLGYVTATKNYSRFFTDSTELASLIAVNYIRLGTKSMNPEKLAKK